jgi:hypothetical protein
MTEPWRQAWVTALDALEADVESVERMIQEEHRQQDRPAATPWAPPSELGPLPVDLKSRAAAILDRQLAAARASALSMTTNRRQQAFADRVEVGKAGKSVPSYVDRAV